AQSATWRVRTSSTQTRPPARCARARPGERVLRASRRALCAPYGASMPVAFDLHQGDLVGEAVGEDGVAVGRDVHVAHDVAGERAGDQPGLEFLRLRIEAHHGAGLGEGLAVPQRALGEDDAVGLGLRAARRLPFADLAGLRVEPAQIAAGEIRVPDGVVV